MHATFLYHWVNDYFDTTYVVNTQRPNKNEVCSCRPNWSPIEDQSTRFTPVQSLPVRPGVVPGLQKYICSPIITVHYGLPRSTHVNTRSNKSGSSRWTPGSSRWTPGSSRWTPVHPGQHTVDTRFIPLNTRFITVPYGSLWRCHIAPAKPNGPIPFDLNYKRWNLPGQIVFFHLSPGPYRSIPV